MYFSLFLLVADLPAVFPARQRWRQPVGRPRGATTPLIGRRRSWRHRRHGIRLSTTPVRVRTVSPATRRWVSSSTDWWLERCAFWVWPEILLLTWYLAVTGTCCQLLRYHHHHCRHRQSMSMSMSIRDLRSFVIRFDFESYVRFELRFVVMVRFEIFESSVLSIVIRKETIGGV